MLEKSNIKICSHNLFLFPRAVTRGEWDSVMRSLRAERASVIFVIKTE